MIDLRLRVRAWSTRPRARLALRLAPWLAPRDHTEVVDNEIGSLAWVTKTPEDLIRGERKPERNERG